MEGAARATVDVDSYGYRKNFRTALPQLLAISVKNLLLIVFGSSIGYVTILLTPARDELHLGEDQLSWISSINFICVPIGCVFSGMLTSAIGRKRAMQSVCIPFIIAWGILYISDTATLLYVGLSITGISGGLLEAPVLVYVAEITQPHLRGALASTSSLCVTVGIISQFILGLFLHWRTVTLVNSAVPVIAIVFLFFIPESPHWLLLKGRDNDARKSLQWLRGWTSSDAVQVEFDDLKLINNPSNKVLSNGTLSERITITLKKYTKRTFLLPYALVTFGFFMCHFTGITTLQTYSVIIFDKLQVPMDKNVATAILGVTQMVGMFICIGLIHFTGKRPLVFFSTLGSGFCFFIVACYAYFIEQKHGINMTNLTQNLTANCTITDTCNEENPLAWVPLTFLIGSALISHTGIRQLSWILMGEVFSSEMRSMASGLSSGTAYILGFIANKVFFTMIKRLTLPGTFWFYCGTSFVGIIILYFVLPETEGYTLAEIQQHFAGIKKLPKKVFRAKGHLNANLPGSIKSISATLDECGMSKSNETEERKIYDSKL